MIAAGSYDVVGPYLAHARSVVSGGSVCSNDYSFSKIDRLQTRLANERMFERLERSKVKLKLKWLGGIISVRH